MEGEGKMQKIIYYKLLIIMATIFCLTLGAMIITGDAAEIKLAWDDPQNPEYGTMILIGLEQGAYQWKHDAGIGTMETIVTNLLASTTYHFAAIHYLNGEESALSNSVVAETNQWGNLPDLPILSSQPLPTQNLQLE